MALVLRQDPVICTSTAEGQVALALQPTAAQQKEEPIPLSPWACAAGQRHAIESSTMQYTLLFYPETAGTMSPCTGVNCELPSVCIPDYTRFGVSVAATAALYGGVVSSVQYACTLLRVGSVHCVDPSRLWLWCEPQAVVCACQGWFMFPCCYWCCCPRPAAQGASVLTQCRRPEGQCKGTALSRPLYAHCLALFSCNLPLCTGLHSRTASGMVRSSDMALSLL